LQEYRPGLIPVQIREALNLKNCHSAVSPRPHSRRRHAKSAAKAGPRLVGRQVQKPAQQKGSHTLAVQSVRSAAASSKLSAKSATSRAHCRSPEWPAAEERAPRAGCRP
jgi:hypothetical protein